MNNINLPNTERIISEMMQIANTDPMIQDTMNALANDAERKGLSLSEWNDIKNAMLIELFYRVVSMDDKLIEMIGSDVYNMYNTEA